MSYLLKKLKLTKAKIHDVHYVTRLFSYIDKKTDKQKVREWIKRGKVYVLKHKDNKKVKAAFSYSIIGITGFFSIMYISRISVMPDMQGQGIGTFLLSRIKSRSVRIGATALFLYSLEHAKNFYKKNKLNNIWRIFWWRPKCLKQRG
jgi:N-acetylglutamate synthase-like GNAT family acetyltransferase